MIDFFKKECTTEHITANEFGIIDGENSDKAYVDYNNRDKWIAVVKNKSGYPVNFTAIDNCIEILRPDGNNDNRCDAMLSNHQNLIFIELKDQNKDWIDHAVNDQLATTIRHFKDNYDITKYRKTKAYACNKAHPQFHYSHIELMERFKNDFDVRLCIGSEIVIK